MQLQQRNDPLYHQLRNAFIQVEAQEEQAKEAVKIETEARKMFRMLYENPGAILSNKASFKKACETFLWIQDKNRDIRQFRMNRSQEILLDAYYEMREDTPAVRINILKGRQQGMSTMIGACAVIEMLAHPNTRALIASEEKGGSGENIFMMYQLYFHYFQQLMEDELTEEERENWFWEGDTSKRFKFGDLCQLKNGSAFNVVGEKLVTSRTLQFIHLSEAAFFNHLKDCLGMLRQTIPKTSASAMFIETTAKEYGNDYYDEWMGACAGKSSFRPLFLPWFIHEEYRKEFADEKERDAFEKSLGESEEHEFGNEKELLEMDLMASDWVKHWKTLDFRGYDSIALENLNWRRLVIRELNGVIPEFNRQYPTTPEMAFLSNSAHVLDMVSVRWFANNMVKEPERGQLVERMDGSSIADYKEMRGGILNIWEHPNPHMEYIIGVDVAEGKDSGDFSCAYVLSRLPLRIVCRLRGYDGRRITIKEFARQLYLLGKYYNTAYICPENNSEGASLPAYLSEWGYGNMVPESLLTLQPSNRFGWRNTHGIRDRGITELQEIIYNKEIGIPDAMFVDEAHHFVYVNGRPQAARKGQSSGGGLSVPGSNDDCIFALIGALLANRALPPAKTEEEVKYENLLEENRIRSRNQRRYTDFGDNWLNHI